MTKADPLAIIRVLLQQEADLQAQIDKAIHDVRASGVRWFSISQALDMSPDQLRWRAKRHLGTTPSVPVVRTPQPDQAIQRDEPFPEGEMSVAAAATQLGVSRATIHRRAANGTLKARRDANGTLHIAITPS